MFELDGAMYELVYSLGVIERLEKILGLSLMKTIASNDGMLPIGSLKTVFAAGLKKEDGGRLPQEQGSKIAENYMEKEGYMQTVRLFMEAVQRDCPFLFQGA